MAAVPAEMFAAVLMGNGGPEKLQYKKVLACGVNNTDINTRLGWYSAKVKTSTSDSADGAVGVEEDVDEGGWSGATPFPLIQGTDCCGKVVQIGTGADTTLLGERVMVRPCQNLPEGGSQWLASDFDGAFAQYVRVRSDSLYPVHAASWTDAELGAIPCAYGTAENMLIAAGCKAGQHVLVPGASGGVGSAVVQLAKRRGATVTAISSADKAPALKGLGADEVLIGRHGSPGWSDILAKLKGTVDLVVDNVGGAAFPDMLELLKTGGTLITSGAIAGPVVDLDLRTLYLRDLRLLGTTRWADEVMPNLVGYVERGEIKPLVYKEMPLSAINAAQELFMLKQHVGKIVLIPPL